MDTSHDVTINHLIDGSGAAWVALGALGGIARVFGTWSNTPPINFKSGIFVIFINVFISGFSGFMGATIASQIVETQQSLIIASGIFGYLGVNGLDWLSDRIKEKFNLNK